VREKVLSLIGGLPDYRGPLRPRVTKTTPRDGYVIENVMFDSLPDYVVTANLYRPDRPGRYPAILMSMGHWDSGKAAGQLLSVNLARRGFVVLAYDPVGQGERQQAFDPRFGRSLIGGPTDQHFSNGAAAILMGQALSRQCLCKIGSLDQPHGEEVLALMLPNFINRHDVRMIQARHRLGLAIEPLDEIARGNRPLPNHLEGHGAFDTDLSRLKDHAHAAARNFRLQLVVAEEPDARGSARVGRRGGREPRRLRSFCGWRLAPVTALHRHVKKTRCTKGFRRMGRQHGSTFGTSASRAGQVFRHDGVRVITGAENSQS